MSEYVIKKTNETELTFNSTQWNKANVAKIENANWSEFSYVPDTKVYLLYNEKGIYVKFVTDEEPVLARFQNMNDNVYLDSCVEIFIQPNLNNKNYFNFEINAGGTPLIGYGVDKKSRKRLVLSDIEQFRIQTNRLEKGFELLLFIPFEFLKSYTGELSHYFLGNLQKCCEESAKPHFVTYYKILTEKPSFHEPEFFDKFLFE